MAKTHVEGECEFYTGGRCFRSDWSFIGEGKESLREFRLEDPEAISLCEARNLHRGGGVNEQVASDQQRCQGYEAGPNRTMNVCSRIL